MSRKVVVDGFMLGTAVVPDSNTVNVPRKPACKLWCLNVLKQKVEDCLTFLLRKTHNVCSEQCVDKDHPLGCVLITG